MLHMQIASFCRSHISSTSSALIYMEQVSSNFLMCGPHWVFCRSLVTLIKAVFPSQDYTWLVDEVKQNLPLELDFLAEAANAERCKQNFSSSK